MKKALRPTRAATSLLWLLLGAAAAAAEPIPRDIVMSVAQGRDIVVLPSAPAAATYLESKLGPINGESFETGAGRKHIVEFQGKTFSTTTPLEGPLSRVVFDPARRAFVPLLPSIRVELGSGAGLDAVAEALGTVKVEAFTSLGFAFIDLPESLHPMEALRMLSQLPNPPRAALRTQAPKIKWR